MTDIEDQHKGRASDEELARVRSKIGQRVHIAEPPYLSEVTRDACRHWAWATGDKNPLFLDEAYAKKSVHGKLLSPPCMLYGFDRMSIGYRGGLPGVHSMFGGSWWKWHQPIALGERITTEVTFKGLEEFPSRFAERMFKQISEIKFLGGDGTELATAHSWGMRTERAKAKEKAKYKALEQTQFTADEIKDISNLYKKEVCRGAMPLYYEDVELEEDIPQIIRGPYSATIAVAFEQAWGGLFIWAHGYWFDFISRHPAAGILNKNQVPEPPEAVHWDSELAKSVGVPDAYDYGPERISWLATMLTNWIGDDGFLEELYVEIRRFNLLGDLTYCLGKVIEKEPVVKGKGRVKLEVLAKDQRGQVTAKGWAKVVLVSKHH